MGSRTVGASVERDADWGLAGQGEVEALTDHYS